MEGMKTDHAVDVVGAVVTFSGPSSRPLRCLAAQAVQVQVVSDRQCRAHQAYLACLMRGDVSPGEPGTYPRLRVKYSELGESGARGISPSSKAAPAGHGHHHSSPSVPSTWCGIAARSLKHVPGETNSAVYLARSQKADGARCAAPSLLNVTRLVLPPFPLPTSARSRLHPHHRRLRNRRPPTTSIGYH